MPPPFEGFGPPRRLWVVGPLLLVFVQVIGTFGASRGQPEARDPDVLAVLLAAAGPLCLYAVRRRPRTVLVSVTLVTGVYLANGYAFGPIFASFVVASVVNVASGRRAEAWAAVSVLAVLAVLTHVVLLDHDWSWGLFAGVLSWALLTLAIGELVRVNRARAAAYGRARAEERRREAGEERLRVARELHDVVAHHMSLIHVQAGVALHLVDRRAVPEGGQVETALTTIKDASKEALTELRALIGVLRAEGEDAPRAPVARLEGLHDVADRASHAGVTTTVDVDGDLAAVPAGVGTAAYRIVQEAVTNVVRHSGATRARIEVRVGGQDLDVRVSDNGRGPAGDQQAGTGLRGLRERAAALDGTVELGPAPGGGALLHATLPLGNGA